MPTELLPVAEFVHSEWEKFQTTETIEPITKEHIALAQKVIDGNWGRNKYKFFLVLASINLINAAIKTPEHKKTLSYTYIKGAATKLLRRLMHDDVYCEELTYFYNSSERCLYFQCLGVIFSFHNVPLYDELQKITTYKEITFPGIRLQKIAVPLLQFAWDQSLIRHLKEDWSSIYQK